MPGKFPSTRIKSPAPRPRPAPPSSRRRSPSYDRQSDDGSFLPRRASRSEGRRRSRERAEEGDRHRRRDSTASPVRRMDDRRRSHDDRKDRGDDADRGRRHNSLAPESRRRDDSSTSIPSPPTLKPGTAAGAFYQSQVPHRDGRRSTTPDKYKPAHLKDEPPAMLPQASGAGALLGKLPSTFATYAGVKAVTKHADAAKEWVDWLRELGDAPDEIDSLSAKAATARDTIKQVQETLKARPDLLDGDNGEQLKEQIEDSIEDTDKALGKMTKLLAEISKSSARENPAVNGLQDFWRSYRYKEDYKDKVDKANDDLQKELTGLSTLTMNLYSRSMAKPAPPPVLPKDEKALKDEKSPEIVEPVVKKKVVIEENSEPKHVPGRPGLHFISPPASFDGMSPPRSPSVLSQEEAAVGSPPLRRPTPLKKPASPPPTRESSQEEKIVVDDGEVREEKVKREDSEGIREEKVKKVDGEEVLKEKVEVKKKKAEDVLLDAAWDGDLKALAEALRRVSVNTCDSHGITALHLAAERDNLPSVMLLLDRGADIEARSDGGRTPLHLACRLATSSTVECLLERGKADANSLSSKGRTPLHYAASAAKDGDEERREVVRVLRDWGSDPTVKDKGGETARDVAQGREHWDAASTLRRAERKWEEDHKQNWLQRHGFMK